MAHGISVGIDIGGTFTDVIASGPAGIFILKVPSTRANPGDAVRTALAELSQRTGVKANQIVRFAHGTTVATNAVIERQGARVGVIATEGFRDILEIGRQMRRKMYDLRLQPETPVWLAPAARRVEVKGRIAADGKELIPLDDASISTAIATLKGEKVNAVAISLLFSFLDPSHERRVAERVRAALPGVAVSLSCEVDPAFREYERTVVTAFENIVCAPADKLVITGISFQLGSSAASKNLIVACATVQQIAGSIRNQHIISVSAKGEIESPRAVQTVVAVAPVQGVRSAATI